MKGSLTDLLVKVWECLLLELLMGPEGLPNCIPCRSLERTTHYAGPLCEASQALSQQAHPVAKLTTGQLSHSQHRGHLPCLSVMGELLLTWSLGPPGKVLLLPRGADRKAERLAYGSLAVGATGMKALVADAWAVDEAPCGWGCGPTSLPSCP